MAATVTISSLYLQAPQCHTTTVGPVSPAAIPFTLSLDFLLENHIAHIFSMQLPTSRQHHNDVIFFDVNNYHSLIPLSTKRRKMETGQTVTTEKYVKATI